MDQLFVYGTLRPSQAPSEIADVVRSMQYVGEGTIRGTRYELQSYPAVIVDDRSTSLVRGEVYTLPKDAEALSRLDAYEEFDPADLGSSLFVRDKATVTLQDGSQKQCWVYVYNRPIPREFERLAPWPDTART